MNQMLKGKNDTIFSQYVENTILSYLVSTKKPKQFILKEISMYSWHFQSIPTFNLLKL